MPRLSIRWVRRARNHCTRSSIRSATPAAAATSTTSLVDVPWSNAWPSRCDAVLVHGDGRRNDRVAHQHRGLAEVGGAHREAQPVVGPRRLDQAGVLRQPLRDAADGARARAGRRLGAAGDPGEVAPGGGERAGVAAPLLERLQAGVQICRRRGGVGGGELGVEVLGRYQLGRRLAADVAGGVGPGRTGEHGDPAEQVQRHDQHDRRRPQRARRGADALREREVAFGQGSRARASWGAGWRHFQPLQVVRTGRVAPLHRVHRHERRVG